jgi:hypothetical protein
MTRPTLLTAALALLAAPAAAQSGVRGSPAARFVEAERQWRAGAYDSALTALDALLRDPAAEALRPAIAELTGEPFRSIEVARDARNPRWAADGQHLLFETGTGAALRTHVARMTDTVTRLVEVAGSGAVLHPTGRELAYLEPAAAGAPPMVRWRPLVDRRAPRALATDGMVVRELLWSTDGTTLYGLAGRSGEAAMQVVAWAGATGELRTVTRTDSAKAGLQRAGAHHLVYTLRGGAVVGGGGRGNVPGGGASFEVLDLRDGRTRRFAGRNVAVARDSGVVAWLEGNGPFVLKRLVLDGDAEPETLLRSTLPLASPALSPSGAKVAYQQMPREDWEIFVLTAAGAQPMRVTREIQHDLLPAFLSEERLIAKMGESRHRRVHAYDLIGGVRTRLFHNNSVRTIAPEYEWVPSPDGERLLVVAERDGDTVTPHRHLYLTDLTRPVTAEALIARVDSARLAEFALASFAAEAYAPIDSAVRAAVAEVSVNRVYGYARDLFSFDSKHLTQPGNAKARDYLRTQYQSFGLRGAFEPFTASQGVDRAGIQTANVLAVLPGTTNPELVYVISSHFDSRAEGPGADDNSSGTAVLLETARVLASRPQPATIIFASLTGEESGLLGGREFVRNAQSANVRILGVLNNDMVGWKNDERLDNTIRYSNPGIKDLQHGAALRYSDLITYDAFYYKSTDAQAFYDGYGDIVGGIGSYPVLGNPHYHQPHDVLETIDHQLVAEVAKTTVASIMMLASSPARLTGLEAERSGGAVTLRWTAAPERDVTGYRVRVTAPGGQVRELTSAEPTLRLTDVAPGSEVAVKAVNARGLAGWDWARTSVR